MSPDWHWHQRLRPRDHAGKVVKRSLTRTPRRNARSVTALTRTAAQKITSDPELLGRIFDFLPLATTLKMRQVSRKCLKAASASTKFKEASSNGLMTLSRPSARVLATPELVEMIFNHLPYRALLRCQKVCVTFRDIVAKSPSMQKSLFFRLDTGETVDQRSALIEPKTGWMMAGPQEIPRHLAPRNYMLAPSRYNPFVQHVEYITIGRYTVHTLQVYGSEMRDWLDDTVGYHRTIPLAARLADKPVSNISRLRLYFYTADRPDPFDFLPEGNWRDMWLSDVPIWVDIEARGDANYLRNKVAVHTVRDLMIGVRATEDDLHTIQEQSYRGGVGVPRRGAEHHYGMGRNGIHGTQQSGVLRVSTDEELAPPSRKKYAISDDGGKRRRDRRRRTSTSRNSPDIDFQLY